MATEPEPTQPKPSAPVRLARRAAEPVASRRGRTVALTALIAAVVAAAPGPIDMVGSAALVGLVWELARR